MSVVLRKKVAMLIVAALFVGAFSGCSTMRRKFVRKKAKQEPDLYLDLKDYPEAPTAGMYANYYAFVKGWLDEVTIQLEEGSNYKRIRYSMDKSIESLLIIKNYFRLEEQNKIDEIYDEFLDLKSRVDDVYTIDFRRQSIIKQAYKLRRKFAKQFNYKKVKNLLN